MEGRRIEVSATQVIASLLAAVTGAIAASTLGIAGTIIGTAVMSVASTAVASIYKHYLARSQERLRKAAEAARASERAAAFRSRHGTVGAHAVTRTSSTDGAHAATRTSSTDAVADADKTQVFPAVSSAQHRWRDADRANGVGRLDDAPTAIRGVSEERAADVTGEAEVTRERAAGVAGYPGQPPSGAGDETGQHGGNSSAPETAGRPRWRRPLALAGIAVGIFLLAMAGITAFEAIAGKPLDALVGGKHSSGTTIGNLVGQSPHTASHHTGRSPAPSPSSTPTPSASPSVSPSPSTSPSPAPSPTPTSAGTPTPTPGTTAGATTGAAGDTPAAAHEAVTPTPAR